MADTPQPSSGSAPFNMAIATLMRLDSILNIIKTNSALYGDASKGGVAVKLNDINNFYIQATPLLSKEKKESTEIKIGKETYAGLNALRLDIKDRIEKWQRLGFESQIDSKRSKGFSNELDEFLILVQEKLQEDGYFMPPSKDPRRAIVN